MTKYHYTRHLNRAFWNSFFATLSAVVLVLIIVYGWQGIQEALRKTGIFNDANSPEVVEEDRLEMLESLRGEDNVSAEEKHQVLEALKAPEESMLTEEQRASILESL